jgi:hypothetical protein
MSPPAANNPSTTEPSHAPKWIDAQPAERLRDGRAHLDGHPFVPLFDGGTEPPRPLDLLADAPVAGRLLQSRGRNHEPSPSPGLPRDPLHHPQLGPVDGALEAPAGRVLDRNRVLCVDLRRLHPVRRVQRVDGGHGAPVELVHTGRVDPARFEPEPKPVAPVAVVRANKQGLGRDPLAHEPRVRRKATGREDARRTAEIAGSQRLAQPQQRTGPQQRLAQRARIELPSDGERVAGRARGDDRAPRNEPVELLVEAFVHHALQPRIAVGAVRTERIPIRVPPHHP